MQTGRAMGSTLKCLSFRCPDKKCIFWPENLPFLFDWFFIDATFGERKSGEFLLEIEILVKILFTYKMLQGFLIHLGGHPPHKLFQHANFWPWRKPNKLESGKFSFEHVHTVATHQLPAVYPIPLGLATERVHDLLALIIGYVHDKFIASLLLGK